MMSCRREEAIDSEKEDAPSPSPFLSCRSMAFRLIHASVTLQAHTVHTSPSLPPFHCFLLPTPPILTLPGMLNDPDSPRRWQTPGRLQDGLSLHSVALFNRCAYLRPPLAHLLAFFFS